MMKIYKKTAFRAARMIAVLAIFLVVVASTSFAGESETGFSVGRGTLYSSTTSTNEKAPSIFSAKYSFSLLSGLQPYVGTGVAYILPQDPIASDPSTKLKTGLAGEAGLHVSLGGSSSLAVDYKYTHFPSTPSSSNDKGSPPQSLGVGLQFHF